MKLTARKVSVMEKELAALAVDTQRQLQLLAGGTTNYSPMQDLGVLITDTNLKIVSLIEEMERIHEVRFALHALISDFNTEHGVNDLLLSIEEAKVNMAMYNSLSTNRVLTSQMLNLELSRTVIFKQMMFDGNSNANANVMQTFNIVTMSESTLDFVKQKQKECKFALTALQDELAFINSSKTIDLSDELVDSLKELNQI
jgi:hypothetical protein